MDILQQSPLRKLFGDGQNRVKTLRYYLFFAIDTWSKRYVIDQPLNRVR
jgi:hypothetical protein